MQLRRVTIGLLFLSFALLLAACGPKGAKKNVKSDEVGPGRDRELFLESLENLRKSRYERGRLQLSTLINAYDKSPYLALARLAVADSFYKEGGSSNLAQAKYEYTEWLRFFDTTQPALACEVMFKIAEIDLRQVQAPDREQKHAIDAEYTLVTLLKKYPDCSRLDDVKGKLKEVQELRAEHNWRVAQFNEYQRQAHAGAADRLKEIREKYAEFSKMDEVLYLSAIVEVAREDTEQAGKHFAELLRRFPNSSKAKEAAEYLKKFEMEIPQPDPNPPPAKAKQGMLNKVKIMAFDPGIDTSEDGILLKKNGDPDASVLQALEAAHKEWDNTPGALIVKSGPQKNSAGPTTTATPTTAQPGKSGDVKIGVTNSKEKPEKKDDKKEKP